MRMFSRSLAAASLAVASPIVAQPQDRVLEVPPTKSWQHAATGMILPPVAAGLTRGAIIDNSSAEQDVGAAYGGEEGLTTSVYLFQTPLADPAVWTDRALAAIALRPDLGLDPASVPAAIPFKRPGASAASGLRATLPLSASGLTATAVALAPLDGWLVKIRMTSDRLDRAALDARLTAFLEALRWPAETRPAPATAAVVACPDSLSFKKAKTVKDSMGDVLMSALAGTVQADQVEKGETRSAVYCREPGPLKTYAVYRPDRSRAAYVIALGDAGEALRLEPALSLDGLGSGKSSGGRVAMTSMKHATISVLPSFNRLPSPEQALSVAFSGKPRETISVTTSPGKD